MARSTPKEEDKAEDKAGSIRFVTKFEGKELVCETLMDDCVDDLKRQIEHATNVPRKRQKLLGLVKGALPRNDARLGDLRYVRHKIVDDDDDETWKEVSFTLMGTPDDKLLPPKNDTDAALAFAEEWKLKNESVLRSFATSLEVNWLAPHRPGKPLLVLDLDHTLVDFDRRTTRTIAQRPYLKEFLATAFEYYDLVVWSQTSWRWLEVKLTELGLLPSTKIAFVLDKRSMFSISSANLRGSTVHHRVKPLDLIWRRCSFWHQKNTLHIDDLERNFVLNPRNGLRCRPFHRDYADNDNELSLLSRYLVTVSRSSDFSELDHSNWREVTALDDVGSPPPNNNTGPPPPGP